MKRVLAAVFFLPFLLGTAGCGYTTKTSLSDSIKVIHIAPVKNAIDLSSEISDKGRFRVYRPGTEVDITNAIINRFIFDGHLKVGSPETSNAILETKLVDYRRDSLRYSDADDVQEYRLTIVLDAVLYSLPDRKVIWRQSSLIGDTTFFLSGPRAVSEDEAAAKAIEDVSRRIIERTLEAW